MAEQVFNDPATLREMMDEGKLFGGDIIAEPVSAAHSMEKLLFSTLMEGVWTTGIEFSYPVIVLPDEIPQDGTGCEGYSPVDVDIPGDGNVKLSVERTPEPWLEGFVCDNELGAGYWLMGVRYDSTQKQCCENIDDKQICDFCPGGESVVVEALPGMFTLGDDSWAGLTKREVVFNAVNGWASHDFSNDWITSTNQFDDTETLNNLVTGDLALTSGAVTIPVCTLQGMLDTVWADPTNNAESAAFPCPS